MDFAAFEDLIGRWGDDFSHWPDDERRRAEELLVSSTEARALLEDARALRHALVGGPQIGFPAGLADRIFAAAFKATEEPKGPANGEEQPEASLVAGK